MGDLKYPPDADTLRRLWAMTDPEELRRRGITTEAYFRDVAYADESLQDEEPLKVAVDGLP